MFKPWQYGVMVWSITLLLVGCQRSDQPPLGRVTGRVTVGDQPVTNADVVFMPDDGRPSYGRTDDDGRYELVYIRDTKGAKVGKHKASVRSNKVNKKQEHDVEVKAQANVIDLVCDPPANKQAGPAVIEDN